MGERKGDDLTGEGGVGKGFLVACHAGGKTEFGGLADAVGAEAAAPEDAAIGQDEGGGGTRRAG
jgi:hypothetical protein